MPITTPAELRAAQQELGWTDGDLAAFLRLGKHGARTVRYWRETLPDGTQRGVPGPVQVAVELHLTAMRGGKKVPA